MFKQLAPSAVEKMRTEGRIILTVQTGWEASTNMCAIPYKINICIGDQLDHIFNCYLFLHQKTLVISDITSVSTITADKKVVDGYLDLAIDGIIKFAKIQNATRIIVDSYIKCMADHLPNYGFKIIKTKGDIRTIKGILLLK